MTTATLTVEPTENDLARIRPGDRITRIDDRPLSRPPVVKGEYANGRIPLVNDLGTDTVHNLYPDTQVGSTITVERTYAAPAPAPQPAPKKARKPVTRTIDGLRLVSEGGGAWRTEDGRYEIRLSYGGLTECEGDHPVRITWAMVEEARQYPGRAWARPILTAFALGRSGYLCQAGSEHQAPDAWSVWDNERDDYVGNFGSHAESFTAAARDLARHLHGQKG